MIADLDNWMRLSGHTNETLAPHLGVDPSTVSKYKFGKVVPGKKVMRKLFYLSDKTVEPNSFYLTKIERGQIYG